MKSISEYTIPVAGLKTGMHEFDYSVDWRFFENFEESPVKQGAFKVHVRLDKDQDHWLVIFEVEGSFDTECDRCLAPIALPVSGMHTVVVKHLEEEEDEEKDADIIYLPEEIHDWNIADLIYEFILLSIPPRSVYDCMEEENPPCDLKALERLTGEREEENGDNPFKDALKNIELKN